jgi:hypothetical protein
LILEWRTGGVPVTKKAKIKAQKKAGEDVNLDEALAETVPASDPPSMTQPRTGADVPLVPHSLLLMSSSAVPRATRVFTVYPLCLLFRRSAWAIPMREQHILWWSGLRGALALALALALPPSFPLHDEILIAAFGVVVFSVVAQGLTKPLLLRRLGFLTLKK